MAGQWVVAHAGTTSVVSRNVQIDRIVPHENAWASRVRNWTPAQRNRFANAPVELLAVSAHENESKGSRGPESWQPELHSYWPIYATRWIHIKSAYHLSFTPAEKRARIG